MNSKEEVKVAVIGGGFAGLLSAYTAAKRHGANNVVIFKKADGASSLFSGTFDIFGYNPLTGEPLKSSKEGIEIVVNRFPNHPYTVAGRISDGTSKEEVLDNTLKTLDDAIKLFQEITKNLILGELDKNVFIPTTLGTCTVTTFYLPSMKEGILETLHKKKVLIVGFHGYSEAYPNFIAKELEYRAAKLGIELKAKGERIKIPGLSIESDLDPFSISRAMDNEEVFKEFTRVIKSNLNIQGVDKIAFPPVLGYVRFRERYKELSEELGVDVFELASPPPTIAGIRIIREIVRKLPIRTLRGDVYSYTHDKKEVTSLLINDYGEESQVAAEKVILATGKFISDGIVQDKRRMKERIFGLPVFDGKQWVSEYSPLKFGRALFFDRKMHKVMMLGIKVNASMQPLNMDNQVAFKNLYAAGSVIGGYNYPYEKNGFGVSLLTAYIAGGKN